MKSSFLQVSIQEEDWFKTSFSIHAGYFDWLIMYIDNVLIFSKSIEEHFKHVQKFS